MMETFVWVRDRFGITGCFPGERVEVRDFPGGTFVSIYERGRTTPTRVVQGEVVYMGPERRRVERGTTETIFNTEVVSDG